MQRKPKERMIRLNRTRDWLQGSGENHHVSQQQPLQQQPLQQQQQLQPGCSRGGSFVSERGTSSQRYHSAQESGQGQRGYGSMSDSLSIVRTESCKSRKTSTDSGIAGSIGIGSVIPDMYQRRGTIIRRQSSSPARTLCGTVSLKLLYLFRSSDLLVKIEQVANIPPITAARACDLPSPDQFRPYVTLETVPPVDGVLRQTAVHNASEYSPRFGETFKLPLPYEQLYCHSLQLSLLAVLPSNGGEVQPRRRKLSQARLSLDAVDPSMEIDIWLDMTTVLDPERCSSHGKLLLSLNFLPVAERLSIIVMKAKDLKTISNSSLDFGPGKLEWFVRVEHRVGDRVQKRRRTRARRCEEQQEAASAVAAGGGDTGSSGSGLAVVVWNEELVFKIPASSTTEETATAVVLRLVQRDPTGTDLDVGCVVLSHSQQAPKVAREQWHDSVVCGRGSSTIWHDLETNLD